MGKRRRVSLHTPGAWHAVGSWVEHEDDKVADICTCNPVDFGQHHLGRSHEEVLANSRLIAAAPEMLAVLKFCRDMLGKQELEEMYDHIPELNAAMLNRVHAVINKVEVLM